METTLQKTMREWASVRGFKPSICLANSLNYHSVNGLSASDQCSVWVARIKQDTTVSNEPFISKVYYNTFSEQPVIVHYLGIVGRFSLDHPFFQNNQSKFYFKVQMHSGKGLPPMLFYANGNISNSSTYFGMFQCKWTGVGQLTYYNDFDITVEMRYYPNAQ